jgi:hypothetical protein
MNDLALLFLLALAFAGAALYVRICDRAASDGAA